MVAWEKVVCPDGQLKGLASCERREETIEAVFVTWHFHLFWCSLNTCQSWSVMVGTSISFVCTLSQWGGAGSLLQSIIDGTGSCQGERLLARVLCSVLGLLPFLTPFWEIWLELLGSLILVGSVLAVDKSLIAVDVLLIQALSVVSDSVCDYTVHAEMSSLYHSGEGNAEQQWPVNVWSLGLLCLYSWWTLSWLL